MAVADKTCAGWALFEQHTRLRGENMAPLPVLKRNRLGKRTLAVADWNNLAVSVGDFEMDIRKIPCSTGSSRCLNSRIIGQAL